MNLSFLKREATIGLNKIYLGLEKFDFYPRYHVVINPTVLEQSRADLQRLNCVKFVGTRAARAVGQREDALTYLVDTDHPPARFSTDLSDGLHEGWTVTHAALQVAFHLGFVEVILIGLDHRYVFDGLPNEARQMEGADPNHFAPAYFGYGQNWDNPDLVQSEASYRAARLAFESAGRRVLDATLDGSCNVFQKVNYRDVFAPSFDTDPNLN